MSAQDFFLLSVLLAVAGAIAALLLNRYGRVANIVTGVSGFVAALLGLVAGMSVLITGQGFKLLLDAGLPFARLVFNVDQLSAFMVVVICFLTLAVSLYSIKYLDEYLTKNPGVLGCLINLFIASMLLVVTVGNAFYFLIFWEVMTLASYFLVIYEQDKQSLRAGFLYFLVAHAGTALIMLAFLLLYQAAGSFDFDAFRVIKLAPAAASLVFVLAFIGFSAKAGAVPLHFWLPEAHSAAPSNVSSLLSGVMIKTAIYMIIRVCVEFLGAGPWWWGFVVLLIGVISTVLGPIYALTQHDIKRLLAFHSVEYVGIILMGVGAGMLGLALNNPVIGVIGLMAALYHLLNHAVFKGLLFLGAGSAIYRTHTRDMNHLGGLAKLMPWTALVFFIGAVAISAIPPLNGFVSKWFIYQSLFGLGVSGDFMDKVFVPLFAMLLALAGAGTAMCMVKAYGSTFSGLARGQHAREAKEVPALMLIGKGILAVGTVLFGLGAPLIAPRIATAVSSALRLAPVSVTDGALQVFPGIPAQATLATPIIAVLFVLLLLVPIAIVVITGGAKAGVRVDATPWAAGYKYTPQTFIAPRSFGQPVQTIFQRLLPGKIASREHGHPYGPTPGKYFKRLEYNNQIEDVWERYLMTPVAKAVTWLSQKVQVLQGGNLRVYCLYIIITLVVLLIAIDILNL
jgi:hydrogenase-4 component B